jgi:hypothetical protein
VTELRDLLELPELPPPDIERRLPSLQLPRFRWPRVRVPRPRMRVHRPSHDRVTDLCFLLGLAAFAGGCGWIFPPAAPSGRTRSTRSTATPSGLAQPGRQDRHRRRALRFDAVWACIRLARPNDLADAAARVRAARRRRLPARAATSVTKLLASRTETTALQPLGLLRRTSTRRATPTGARSSRRRPARTATATSSPSSGRSRPTASASSARTGQSTSTSATPTPAANTRTRSRRRDHPLHGLQPRRPHRAVADRVRPRDDRRRPRDGPLPQRRSGATAASRRSCSRASRSSATPRASGCAATGTACSAASATPGGPRSSSRASSRRRCRCRCPTPQFIATGDAQRPEDLPLVRRLAVDDRRRQLRHDDLQEPRGRGAPLPHVQHEPRVVADRADARGDTDLFPLRPATSSRSSSPSSSATSSCRSTRSPRRSSTRSRPAAASGSCRPRSARSAPRATSSPTTRSPSGSKPPGPAAAGRPTRLSAAAAATSPSSPSTA